MTIFQNGVQNMQKATTSELKVTNQKHVLSFIYKVHKTSKSELADKLGYSRPTINQCLKDLEEMKLIEKNGFFGLNAIYVLF